MRLRRENFGVSSNWRWIRIKTRKRARSAIWCAAGGCRDAALCTGRTPGHRDDARAVAGEARGAPMRRAAVLPATHRDRRVTEAFESCQNAKMQFVKKCVPAEDPCYAEALGERRGGAASTISRREAQACPRFGCPSRQSPSDLMASENFGEVFIGAEVLSRRSFQAGAGPGGAKNPRRQLFSRSMTPRRAERDILV